MANKSVLTVVNNALDELGQPRMSSLVSATNDTARRLLRLFNRQGKALSSEKDRGWAVQQRLYTFNTAASTAEYALPADYDYLLEDTVWDRTLIAPGRGPLSPMQWQTIKSGLIGTGAYSRRYRIVRSQVSGVDRKFIIDPTPMAIEAMAFEYVSTDWLEKSDHTTTYDEVNADTDLVILDQTLMELGVAWRWRRAIGFEYASLLSEYNEALDAVIATDAPAFGISLVHDNNISLIGHQNIPETGYG